MAVTPNIVAALDVGARRVGIAVASLDVRLPRPLQTLERGDSFFADLLAVLESEHVDHLVIGYPRGLDGQHTAQTGEIEKFAEELKEHSSLSFDFQDEALTSNMAEVELEARGKPYSKGDIDALAATFILQDFLNELGLKS